MGYKMNSIEPACSAARKVLDLLGGFPDLKEDRAELQRHVKQVASALSYSKDALGSIDDEEVQQALEGIHEALDGVFGALSELADKNVLVKIIMAGSMHEELQSNFNALQSNIAWLSAALAGSNSEGADLAHPLFVGLQATLGNLELRALTNYERMTAGLAEQIDLAVKHRLLAVGSRPPTRNPAHNMTEQLRVIVQAIMGPDVAAQLDYKEVLQEQTMQLQLSAQPLRSTKRDQEELLLAQLVSILSADDDEVAAEAAAAEPIDITICPITQEVMQDPVITASGHTYERAAITAWLRTHDTDPITNKRLAHKMLAPNLSLRKMIQEWQTGASYSGMSSRQGFSRQMSAQLLGGGLDAFTRCQSAVPAAACTTGQSSMPPVPIMRAMSALLPAAPGPVSATPSSPATPVALVSLATPASDKALQAGKPTAAVGTGGDATGSPQSPPAQSLVQAPATPDASSSMATIMEVPSPSQRHAAATRTLPAGATPSNVQAAAALQMPAPVRSTLRTANPTATGAAQPLTTLATPAAATAAAAGRPAAAAPSVPAQVSGSAVKPYHGMNTTRVPGRPAVRRRMPAIAPLPANMPSPAWPTPKWTKASSDSASSRPGPSSRSSHDTARAAAQKDNAVLLASAPIGGDLSAKARDQSAAATAVAQNSNPVYEASTPAAADPKPTTQTPQASEIVPVDEAPSQPAKLQPVTRSASMSLGSGSAASTSLGSPSAPLKTPAPTASPCLAPLATQELLRLLSTSSAPPATVNLLGSTVELPAGQHLLITRPGVTLCNGVIELAPDMQLQVRAKNVTLRDLRIHGRHFRFEVPGLLTNLCKGVVDITSQDTLVQDCNVLMSDVPKHWEGQRISACIRVGNCGTARIEGCHLSGVKGAWPYGLLCMERASVTVAGTTATACEHAFWAVQPGTQISFQGDCEAVDNRWDGFRTTDGAAIVVTRDCRAEECNVGFIAIDKGSQLLLGEGCEARRNRSHGFEARKGASLQTGKGCISAENGGVGFLAHEESTMAVGEANQALGNIAEGFKCRNSQVSTEANCLAEDNGKPRSPSGHKAAGFCVEGPCSMSVGNNNQAIGNAGHGFLAKGGGKMKISLGSKADRNGKKPINAGFLSEITLKTTDVQP